MVSLCVFSKDGMLWAVVDQDNPYAFIYNSRKELVKKIGSSGKDRGQFKKPCYDDK